MPDPPDNSREAPETTRSPYAFTRHEPTGEAGPQVTLLDVVIAFTLAAFAGLIGLFLGPLLALAMTTGGWITGGAPAADSLRGWFIGLSLLFSPLLAYLAFRGHLQAVREGHAASRTRQQEGR